MESTGKSLKPPDREGGSREPGKRLPPSRSWIIALYLAGALLAFGVWEGVVDQLGLRTIPYSEFKTHLSSGEVESCLVKEGEIVGTIRPAVVISEYGESNADPTLTDGEEANEEILSELLQQKEQLGPVFRDCAR